SVAHIKQSIAWWSFARALPPEQLVRAAAEIGYAGIEIAAPEFWPLIADHGLAIVSIVGHDSIPAGLNRRENHDRIVAEIQANLKLAEQWRIPNLICFSGNRAGQDDVEGAEIAAECLRRVARDAENAGVTLVLELLNSKVDHPDYQCDRTAWGVSVCRMVESPRVKLLYDIYHMQIMEGDLIRTIRDNHEFFGHYHTAGNPGRNELDATQEINYPAVVRAIAATGYGGYLGQEFIPTGDAVAALKQAFDICTV
ncbi:MAG TPA: TIM barrel protein, partial [Roseiflexaceae bacterium]|nr:TIM barrel protein [Roseiflexaceae bacterium]